MAKVRRKTANPAAKTYLKYAREQGITLSWNNYERMIPQDGFARLGLSCSDCLMGPCRLNPFATSVERTVCGFDKSDLVYRSLLKLMGASYSDNDKMSSILTAASLCSKPQTSFSSGDVKIGYNVLKSDYINICLEKPCLDTLSEIKNQAAKLEGEAKKAGARGFNISLIGRLAGGYDTVCAESDAEFALLSGIVDGYVLGKTAVGLGRNVASNMHTAVCSSSSPVECVTFAIKAYKNRADKGIIAESETVSVKAYSFADIVQNISGKNIAFIGGGSNIKYTTDEQVINCISEFSKEDVVSVVFSSAAVIAARAGLCSENVICCVDDITVILDYVNEFSAKKIAVLLPEINCGRGLAAAIHMGASGLCVYTETELPINGDPAIFSGINKLVSVLSADEYLSAVSQFFRAEV